MASSPLELAGTCGVCRLKIQCFAIVNNSFICFRGYLSAGPKTTNGTLVCPGVKTGFHTSQGIRPSGGGSAGVYLRALLAFRLAMTDSKDKGFGCASPESVCPHCRAKGFVRVSPFVLRTGRHLHWHCTCCRHVWVERERRAEDRFPYQPPTAK